MAGGTFRPNVVCISLDSVRADDVSIGPGEELQTTPNLAELSTDGTVYERAISPSTWTLPVHASLLTGLYPPEHGLVARDRGLGDHPTLGELFSAAGYETHAFSYNGWLLVGDVLRGFDRDERDWDPDRRFRDALSALGIEQQVYATSEVLLRPQRDEAIVDRACEYVRNTSEPFFALIHLNDAHSRYLPPRSIQDRFTDAGRLKLLWNMLYEQRRVRTNVEQYWAGNRSVDPDTTELMRALYRACLYQVDSLVGDVLAALSAADRTDDTIVAVFADHGDNFGEDGQYGHHFSVSDAVIRIPFVVSDPTGSIEPGATDALAQPNDLYPTLCGLCGIEAPETHSVDLARDRRDCAFSYHVLPEGCHVDRFLERLDDGERPHRKQFVAWKGPDRRGVWYPADDTYVGEESLRSELADHLAALDAGEVFEGGDIEDSVVENLRRLGYL